MSELIWLPEALLDLTEHFEFLKLKNPEAAGLVAQSIRDAGFSLAQIPIAERFSPTGAITGNWLSRLENMGTFCITTSTAKQS
jgi:plasmid stabilization system protein ParE